MKNNCAGACAGHGLCSGMRCIAGKNDTIEAIPGWGFYDGIEYKD